MDVLHEKYIKAGSASTSVEELCELARDEIDNVRRRVGENLQTPVEILVLLAVDENADVRVAVGENPMTPRAVLDQLVQDNNIDVRYALAENPALPVEILSRLLEDDNPYVSHRAACTIRMLQPRTMCGVPELGKNLSQDTTFTLPNIKAG